MDDLCPVDKQNKGVLVYVGLPDLIPFEGHSFTGVDLHQDLLAADLIGEFLK